MAKTKWDDRDFVGSYDTVGATESLKSKFKNFQTDLTSRFDQGVASLFPNSSKDWTQEDFKKVGGPWRNLAQDVEQGKLLRAGRKVGGVVGGGIAAGATIGGALATNQTSAEGALVGGALGFTGTLAAVGSTTLPKKAFQSLRGKALGNDPKAAHPLAKTGLGMTMAPISPQGLKYGTVGAAAGFLMNTDEPGAMTTLGGLAGLGAMYAKNQTVNFMENKAGQSKQSKKTSRFTRKILSRGK